MHRIPSFQPETLRPYGLGVRWAVSARDDMTFVYWVLAEGSRFGMHQHPTPHTGIVLEGAVSVTYGDGSHHVYDAGSMYTIAADVPHAVDVVEETTLMDVFIPARTDLVERYESGHWHDTGLEDPALFGAGASPNGKASSSEPRGRRAS